MNARVSILLSTYNGAAYLRPQLESLSNQTYKDFVIKVRDDGSTDDTRPILADYAKADDRVSLLHGDNLGVIRSFFELLRSADNESEYYAFCDQDDIWLPGKIERAVALLKENKNDGPLLYCSRVEFTDAELKSQGFSAMPSYVGFNNALVENIVYGCTVVMNRQARDIIIASLPDYTVMHDWWFYLVISAFGKIIYDEEAHIKYRLHGDNVMGAGTSSMNRFMIRTNKFLKQGSKAFNFKRQAREFSRIFGAQLDPAKKALLDRFLSAGESIGSRFNYAFKKDVHRQSPAADFLLRIVIILGWY